MTARAHCQNGAFLSAHADHVQSSEFDLCSGQGSTFAIKTSEPHSNNEKCDVQLYYRKRGSASYIVREVRSARDR